MKHAMSVWMLCAAAALAPQARAQQAAPAGQEALPAWEQLPQSRRDELVAPMRERWNRNPGERARMLERARRWQSLTPEQRQRAHRGMQRWERMDPAERAKLRALFERTRDMPRQQRRETLALYRAMLPMSTSEREALKQRWAGMTAEQRREWLRANAPRWRDGPGRGPDTPR